MPLGVQDSYVLSRRRDSQGFSLLELLATLIILVILAALILSALPRVLDSANSAKCMSNLRAIGAGLHAYMADFNGEYPPNRHNTRYTEETGRSPWPSEVLNGSVPTNKTAYVKFSGRGTDYLKTRKDGGPWFCPADKERPMALSADSYGYNIYLGRDDRTSDAQNTSWQPWWSKPAANERSGRLIYLVDHTLARVPLSTGGTFSEKSWPLKSGVKPSENSGDGMVDFDRHGTHSNALLVDGSVKSFSEEDLRGSEARKFVDPTR